MKMNKWLERITAFLLIFLLGMQIPVPVLATEENDTIYIKNADDLVELAEQCVLDTWSQGKTIILRADIDMNEEAFEPIPTFGGTFDGNGYSITGVYVSGSYALAGLFGNVQTGAVVKNLSVSGSIQPDGEAEAVGGIAGKNAGAIQNCSFYGYVDGTDSVGGIAGVNEETGEIRSCQSSANASGKCATGGIVGNNHGVVNGCKNTGGVNTDVADIVYEISDLNFASIGDQSSATDAASHSDCGGIAGISDGKIYDCSNEGVVGYPHVGYNVGGIVGRLHQGYLQDCMNMGTVYGRKDVGGIAGQMEPFLEIEYLDGKLEELDRETERLFDLIDTAYDDMSGYGDQASSLIKSISSDLKAANTAGSNMSAAQNQMWDSYHQEVWEINDELKSYEGDPAENYDQITESASGHADDMLNASKAYGTTVADNMKVFNERMESAGNSLEQLPDVLMEGADKTDADVNAIAEQSRALRSLIGEIRDDLFRVEGISVNDVSGQDITYDASEFQKGKLTLCTNRGTVEADLNVAGVVGQIGTEYDMDPERDVSFSGTETMEIRHTVNAVVRNSKNYGEVTAKKDYAGGIVGKTELGAVIFCEDYGKIASTGGNYIGGIAGYSGGTIRDCFVKASLEGNMYIGGIAGSGMENDQSGEEDDACSVIENCYSFVDILNAEQYAGAISGTEAGSFIENYFVSNNLAGVDRVSLSGKAEPIAYEKLISEREVPDEFKEFTLKFVADDTTLKSVTFTYGDSFAQSVFPEIPSKDGYYAKWDRTELKNLTFDTEVTAVYSEYIEALKSENSRKDERPVFFVEGQFEEGDSLVVLKNEDKEDILDSGAIQKNRLAEQEVLERWQIRIPEDALKEHTIRYLASEENGTHLKLYVNGTDGWERVETQEIGSYLTFAAEGNTVELAVLSEETVWWFYAAAAGILALLVAGISVLMKKKKHRAKKKPERKPEEKENGEKAKEKENGEKNGNGRKKRKWLSIVLMIAGILCIAFVVAVLIFHNFRNGMDAYELLKEYDQRDEISMQLAIDAKIGTEQIDTELAVMRTQAAGQKVTCIDQGGMYLYYADGVIFLENGKAFEISEFFPDYSILLTQAMELYGSVDIQVADTERGKEYHISTKQDEAKQMMEILIPSYAKLLSDAQVLNLNLIVVEGELSEIEFSAEGNLDDSDQTEVSVTASMTIDDREETQVTVPQNIVELLETGDYETEAVLSEELFRLARAWNEFGKQETMATAMELTADCGPLTVNDELLLIQKQEGNTQISCIRKNEEALYFAGDKFCNRDGSVLAGTNEALAKSAKLPTIAYQLCLNGKMNCTKANEKYIYTLVLEKEGMEAIAHAIAPETEKMELLFDTGSIQIIVEDETITEMRIICNGQIEVLQVETPVSFAANLQFDESKLPDGFSIPQAVIETLTEEE